MVRHNNKKNTKSDRQPPDLRSDSIVAPDNPSLEEAVQEEDIQKDATSQVQKDEQLMSMLVNRPTMSAVPHLNKQKVSTPETSRLRSPLFGMGMPLTPLGIYPMGEPGYGLYLLKGRYGDYNISYYPQGYNSKGSMLAEAPQSGYFPMSPMSRKQRQEEKKLETNVDTQSLSMDETP